MWRTSMGERTLCGAEADLVRAAVAYMLDELHNEANGRTDELEYGVTLFDELFWQQRLALLNRVARALLDPTIEPPKLSAVNESTVAAIYAQIRQNVTVELDEEKSRDLPSDYDFYYWRRLVSACQTDRDQDDRYFVEINSSNSSDWNHLIEVLQDQVLWDDDWDMPELFMDVLPEVSDGRKECLGIDTDYFTALAPDLRDSDVSEVFSSLRQLTGRKE